MALTTTLTKYAGKLRDYLSIWKKSGTQYDATHPDPAIRGTEMAAALVDLVGHELAPSVLTVGTMTDTTAAISWTTSTATTKSFELFYSKYPKKGFTSVYSGTGLSKSVTGLSPSTKYYFKVVSSGSDTTYDYVPATSLVGSGTTTIPQLAISGSLAASAVTATTATLTWAAVANATSYLLERATNVGFTTGLTTVYTGALLTANDSSLVTATDYYYRVTASADGYLNSVQTSSKVTTS